MQEAWNQLKETYLTKEAVQSANMFGWEGLSVHGNVFCSWSEEGMTFKVGAEQCPALCERLEVRLFSPNARMTMKDWLHALPHQESLWPELAARAFDYVSSLPPKVPKVRKSGK